MTVLVTGASGFVGRRLVTQLVTRGVAVRPASRRPANGHFAMGDLSGTADWRAMVDGCRSVVHLAARVHRGNALTPQDRQRYGEENVEATLNLARQAAEAGAGRFVFVSSVKVHGDQSPAHGPFVETSAIAPTDAYGHSKADAEAALFAFGQQSGLEIVSVRPPLVYGPGVRANFRSLLQAVRRGVPLPFGAVDNRRSLVGLDNLCDFLTVTLAHPAAAGEAFLVSDGVDLSTAELVRSMGRAVGRRPVLLPVPPALLVGMLKAAGRGGLAERLVGDLQVGIDKARERLGWTPRHGLDEELERTVARP